MKRILILILISFCLMGCSKMDTSNLVFDPTGTWVNLNTGDLMCKIKSDGTVLYGDNQTGSWSIKNRQEINLILGDDSFVLSLINVAGYELIGNSNASFCRDRDYSTALDDIYATGNATLG